MKKSSCTSALEFKRICLFPVGIVLLLSLFILPIPVLGNTDFYFPHYADGDGCSMLFTFENPSETAARISKI